MKDRIQEKAMELFMRYGIRSVSMDDIATNLGISKKTIYQYFTDKDNLVDMIVDADIRDIQSDCTSCIHNAENAIHEIFLTMEMTSEFLRNMNPVLLYDLQKFHFSSFRKFTDHRNKFLLEIIMNNLQKGIQEGLYRTEINVEILSRFRLDSMMIPFNIELFPPARFNLMEVHQEILENFLYGLVTEKGYHLILAYKKERVQK